MKRPISLFPEMSQKTRGVNWMLAFAHRFQHNRFKRVALGFFEDIFCKTMFSQRLEKD